METSILLGNWIWSDPLKRENPDAETVQPIQLLRVISGLSTAQNTTSTLQPEWTSLELESGGGILSDEAPLWTFGQNSGDGHADSFGRIAEPSGEESLEVGFDRRRSVENAITPNTYDDLLDLRVSDLAVVPGAIHATGSINRLQRLEEGGFAHQRASSFEQQVLLAGVNFEGGGELLLSDSRGLMLARVDLPISNIHSFVDVGWWGRDQAWVLLQNSREELQLWSVMVGESTEGPQLGSELLATLSSDNGLLRAASNARVINDPGKAPGVLIYLPIPPLLQEGETGLVLIPEARLAVGSNYHSYQIVSFAVPVDPKEQASHVALSNGRLVTLEGKDSLKIFDPKGVVSSLELSLADNEQIIHGSLAVSGSNIYWITSRFDSSSGANQQFIWRSKNGGVPELAHKLLPGQSVQNSYLNSWLRPAGLQGDLFLLDPDGFSGDASLQLMRLARDHVSSGEAQLLDNLEAPGFKGSSIGIADVVASSAADGSVNLLAYAAFSEPGSGELQLGHFQSDGSLMLKPLSDRASSLIDDGALLSSVQPSSGGFLLLDGSNGQADQLSGLGLMGPLTLIFMC